MSAVHNDITPFRAVLQSSQSHELSPQAKMSFNEGLEHLQAGEPAVAAAALYRSLEHSPDFPPTHIFLGIAHALTSNIYPAIDHLEKAARLDRDSFAAHFTLAQLNFKLRIPQKGYEAAERARQCIDTLEQRKMLTNLLKEERARERNGIARPSFNKPFSRSALVLAGGALLAALVAVVMHIR